eukprot:352471-Chlamydomonas_euryale.AAC.5
MGKARQQLGTLFKMLRASSISSTALLTRLLLLSRMKTFFSAVSKSMRVVSLVYICPQSDQFR